MSNHNTQKGHNTVPETTETPVPVPAPQTQAQDEKKKEETAIYSIHSPKNRMAPAPTTTMGGVGRNWR